MQPAPAPIVKQQEASLLDKIIENGNVMTPILDAAIQEPVKAAPVEPAMLPKPEPMPNLYGDPWGSMYNYNYQESYMRFSSRMMRNMDAGPWNRPRQIVRCTVCGKYNTGLTPECFMHGQLVLERG